MFLIEKKRVQLLKKDKITFTKDSFDSVKQRCALYIEIKFNDSIIHIVNLHLEVKDIDSHNKKQIFVKKDAYRMRQIKKILNKYANNVKNNCIILGDFNSTSIFNFLATTHKFISVFGHNIPYLTSIYHNFIDNILYNDYCSNIKPIYAATYKTDLSDHLPIIADFIIKPINNEKQCTDVNFHKSRYQPSNLPIIARFIKTHKIRNIDIILNKQIIDNLPRLEDDGFNCVLVNEPIYLYKGMQVDEKNDNEKILNNYANKPTWYSSAQIALYYVNNNKNKIHTYKTSCGLKLIDLMDGGNVKKLHELLYLKLKLQVIEFKKYYKILIDEKVEEFQKKKEKVEKEIDEIVEKEEEEQKHENEDEEKKQKNNVLKDQDNDNTINIIFQDIDFIITNFTKTKYADTLKKLMLFKHVFETCLGYGITWNEQFNRISAWLNESNPRKMKGTEVLSIPCFPNDAIRIKIKDTFYSHLKEDINRCSVTLEMDILLAECINELINIDGWITSTVPSLWHRYNIFHEEICIFVSRGKIKKIETNVDMSKIVDINEYPYNNELYIKLESLCPSKIIK